MVKLIAPAGRGRRIIKFCTDPDRVVSILRAAYVMLLGIVLGQMIPAPTFSESGNAARPQLASETLTQLTPATNPAGPSFTLDDLTGSPKSLQDFQGKVVLVHFFATWCEPCVREMASLQQLARAARDEPLIVLAINVAEVDLRVRAFFEKHPVDFPVLLDRDRAVSRAWRISMLPSTVVLDGAHTARFIVESDLDWSRKDIRTTLKSIYPPQKKTQHPSQHQSKGRNDHGPT